MRSILRLLPILIVAPALVAGCTGEKDGDLVVPTAEQQEPGENSTSDPEMRDSMGTSTPMGGG